MAVLSEQKLSDALLARAAKLSAATLHEASGRLGALPHALRPLDARMRLTGRALPVQCGSGDNLWIHRALAEASENDVLVVDVGANGAGFGYWGEIMATAALARQVSGLVINGGVRDTLRLIELGLPTFSAAISILGTGKNAKGEGAVGQPVRMGDVVIRRGDLVFGDADGVVVLTPEQASQAIPASEDRDAKEQDILQRITDGALTLDVYKF